jgi:quercetin dioxygenase-like cupin family protein
MKTRSALALALVITAALLAPRPGRAQDALKFGVRQLILLAEDDAVRVIRYAPRAGEKTPMHSHPATTVYVVRGGRVRYTFPDGTTRDGVLRTGEALLRPPVTHADEALDDLEVILIERKAEPAQAPPKP